MALLLVASCSPAPQATGVSDPNEVTNRRIHEFNLRVDQALLGAASDGEEEDGPGAFMKGLTNFASNTSLPSLIVNDLLQGDLEDAAQNSVRLLFNTTIGLGGLFDPATGIGIEKRSTDFGETLHVWGVPEGDYVVMPFFGPSTERDAVGTVVDLFTNPLTYTLGSPEKYLPSVAIVLAPFGARIAYASTIDDILYSSEDSYLTARLFYLDNRRYTLSGGQSSDDLYDIYEEAYE